MLIKKKESFCDGLKRGAGVVKHQQQKMFKLLGITTLHKSVYVCACVRVCVRVCVDPGRRMVSFHIILSHLKLSEHLVPCTLDKFRGG